MDLRPTPTTDSTDSTGPSSPADFVDEAALAAPAAPPAVDGVERADLDESAELDGLGLLDEHSLRRLLASQPVIEQAKGLLIGAYRINADQAFAVLSHWSSHTNVKVRDLAARLVEAAAQPNPLPFWPVEAGLGGDRPWRLHP